MIGKNRLSTVLIIVATFFALPMVMLLVFLTGGAIEPSLPGQRNTWNIQYGLHLVTAILAGACTFVCRRRIGKLWWLLLVWNSLFGILAIYAIVSLWGEIH